jgi:hypothetical protein
VIVQADAGRAQARAQADRGALPAAATILRQIAARIDATEGFVRNDGSLLAELREQIEDEADGDRLLLGDAAFEFKLAR